MYKLIFIALIFLSSTTSAATTHIATHDTTLTYTLHVYDSLPNALVKFCKGYKTSTEKKQLYYAKAYLHNGKLFFKIDIEQGISTASDKCTEEYCSLEGRRSFAKGGKGGNGCGECTGMLAKAKLYNVKINIIII